MKIVQTPSHTHHGSVTSSTLRRHQEMGMDEVLNPDLIGFAFRFKDSPQDFQVHEISEDGDLLYLEEPLTARSVASEQREEQVARHAFIKKHTGPSFKFLPDQLVVLKSSFTENGIAKLQAFLRCQKPGHISIPHGQSAHPFVDVGLVADGSKAVRTRAHEAIRHLFGSFLNTEAIPTTNGEVSNEHVRVWLRSVEKRLKTSENGVSFDSDGGATQAKLSAFYGAPWPKHQPDFLRFRLRKENCDLFDALSIVAKCTGRKTKHFDYAGIKDRCAITVQYITARHLSIDQLKRAICHPRWDERLSVSNLEYVDNPIRMGSLHSNSFTVVLRGLSRAPGSQYVEGTWKHNCDVHVREVKVSDVADAELYDVVLPLPGSGVKYPQHLHACYEQVCNEYLGLPLEAFHSSSFVELQGSYRRIIVRPESLEWRVLDLDDGNLAMSPLCADCYAHLRTCQAVSRSEVDALFQSAPVAPSFALDTSVCDVPDGRTVSSSQSHGREVVALLRCTLPSSVYLTMLLREMMERSPDA